MPDPDQDPDACGVDEVHAGKVPNQAVVILVTYHPQ
jgi:hypothetical protein